MSHRAARFEVVRTDAAQPWPAAAQPWHGRFVAGNGRIVWTTEKYTRRGRVMDAIRLLSFDPHAHDGSSGAPLFVNMNDRCYEVRDVDERGTDT